VRGHFALPLYIDLSATCLYAVTGALLAIRRHYDVVGLFVLALVSGVGGGKPGLVETNFRSWQTRFQREAFRSLRT
jgi:hypothetical protein